MKIFSKSIMWSLAAIQLVPAVIALVIGWDSWTGLTMVLLCGALQVLTAILFLPLLKHMPQQLLRLGKVYYIGLALFFLMWVAVTLRQPRSLETIIFYSMVTLTLVLYIIMLIWTIMLGCAKEERK